MWGINAGWLCGDGVYWVVVRFGHREGEGGGAVKEGKSRRKQIVSLRLVGSPIEERTWFFFRWSALGG